MHINMIILCLFMCSEVYGQNFGNLKSYKTYSFDTDDKICSPITKRTVELPQGNKSAIFIHQTRLNDHSSLWSKNIECRFQVDATPGVISKIGSFIIKSLKEERNIGLFAVIQNIDFRIHSLTGECMDYIQFRGHGTGNRWGPKICGRKNIAIVMEHEGERDVPSMLSFVDDKGIIEVNVFVSKEPLLTWQRMDLKIVFTAYRKCGANSDLCGSSEMKKCISNEYFLDGLVNCPYSRCSDELGDCSSVYTYLQINGDSRDLCLEGDLDNCDIVSPGTSTNTKVTAGAVATLLLSFVVFVLCVWVCKKYGKLCFAADCSNPSPPGHRSNQDTRTIELENRTEGSAPAIPATAPPIDENKDLPPSYDSLFPVR